MNKLRSILVGVDFTPGSSAALRQAIRLGQASGGAAVHAVHVINTHVVIDLQQALSPMQKNIQASLETEARREWLKYEHELPGKDRIDLRIRVGNPASSMLDEVKALAADLLVLGIHREEGAESGAGTVAGACVRRSTSHVLLVRAEQPGRFTRVAACVDFSDVSRQAVIEAARVARMDGATLEIVHVFEPPWRLLHYFAPMPANTPEFQSGYRASLLSKLREFCAPLQSELTGLSVSYRLDDNHSAGRGIVEHASAADVDLIVIGTHGRSNLRDIVLGSTAERVLETAPCSVLAIRPAVIP